VHAPRRHDTPDLGGPGPRRDDAHLIAARRHCPEHCGVDVEGAAFCQHRSEPFLALGSVGSRVHVDRTALKGRPRRAGDSRCRCGWNGCEDSICLADRLCDRVSALDTRAAETFGETLLALSVVTPAAKRADADCAGFYETACEDGTGLAEADEGELGDGKGRDRAPPLRRSWRRRIAFVIVGRGSLKRKRGRWTRCMRLLNQPPTVNSPFVRESCNARRSSSGCQIRTPSL